MDAKIAHLGFIQVIITRMGTNSFLIKGWCITLVAAIFALAPKDTNSTFVLLAYFPILMFWVMDAYFLTQERLYRKLYEQVASGATGSDTFTLKTNAVGKLRSELPIAFFSQTLLPFYGVIIGLVLFVMFTA